MGIFLLAGEYRAQSIPPSQEILFDSLLQRSGATSLTARSSLSDIHPEADKDACNSGCQRLGHELLALLGVMSVERAALAPVPPAKQPAAPLPASRDSAPLNSANLDPAWKPIINRLAADGFDEAEMQALFAGLGRHSYSPAFMAAKIRELYGVQGVGIRQSKGAAPLLSENYGQHLSDFTIGSCLAFMKKYSKELKKIERKHGVPAHYIVGLLLIETGLGSDLGSHSAFRALASMASTTTPKMLGSAGNSRQVKHVRQSALAGTLKEKSNWAYNEVKALIRYAKSHNLDICAIPGSIYGAIGICQFMPSNIQPYAADGDMDGQVNVFSVVDAMYSVASYLEAHGWRGAKDDATRLAVFKAYNRDDYYAASVLATGKQLKLGMSGKVAHSRHVLANVVTRPRAGGGTFLDPSLKNLKPVPETAKVQALGSYQSLLP